MREIKIQIQSSPDDERRVQELLVKEFGEEIKTKVVNVVVNSGAIRRKWLKNFMKT